MDRPIIFSAPMVLALLAGRKTVTRRILKPDPAGTVSAPRWAKGDRLYVRERVRFREGRHEYAAGHGEGDLSGVGFRPSIHMPRIASRITLLVTDVKVERLNDITEEQAWAEGCKRGEPTDNGGFFPAEEADPSGVGQRGWDCARDWFADLWDEINGEGAFDSDPWVAAVSFTVVQANIASLPEAA